MKIVQGNYLQGKVFPDANFSIFAATFYSMNIINSNNFKFMKRSFWVPGLMIIAMACSSPDNQAKLEKLKKEHDQITMKISALEKELNTADKTPATIVSVESLMNQPFNHYIEVQGRIDGNENIGVSPRSAGVVTRVIVNEGETVKKGQELAELDADVLKRNLSDLQSQLSYVTDLYEKQKALWDQKIGSEVQYLTAKNNKESIENKIASLKDQISMSSITSPIDGTVEDIPIKVGQLAQVGVPAFRVINFTKVKAVADVGEAYSSKIKTGDQVKIFLPDFNVELQQNVTFASKFINPTNRTFTVEVELPPSTSMVYRANMIAVIRIKDYSNPSTIAISQNFIQSSKDEGYYVFLAKYENGKKIARKTFIKTGVTYNGLTEVLSGLKEGDKLISAGYKDLYDGQVIDYK
jgi:RND family efflux transporter MFP subunit